MSNVEPFRRFVVARAGGACEYCRLLQDACGVTFHVEHVRPRVLAGETILSNLALSCPGCNLAKAQRIVGIDHSGIERKLFNPRDYEPWLLGWHLHFSLDRESGRILPLTPVGEASVTALGVNERPRLSARRLQIIAGLIG